MTLLQIDKRAITPEEGHDLILRTKSLHDPLGAHVMYLSQADALRIRNVVNVPSEHRTGAFIQVSNFLEPKIKDMMSSQTMRAQHPSLRKELHDNAQILTPILLMQHQWDKYTSDFMLPAHVPAYTENADHYGERGYVQPYFGIVVGAGEKTGFRYASSYMQDVGAREADKFYVLWHEIAHGIGAGEPQADMIAAVMTRRSFEPSHILRRWADERALHAVLHSDDEKNRNKYGWGCVDANDYAADLPEGKVLSLTERQIRQIRFMKFDPLSESVERVGKLIRENAPHYEVFGKINYQYLWQTALDLSETEFSGHKKEQYICDRFALACARVDTHDEVYDRLSFAKKSEELYPSFIDEPEI